ncbi:MAG TPA: MBL fold metallo-hydrolase [Gammaproteobacteria bacterium]|nr:MBL fold metallo-hydrolase [Gammaproteobacteria bacterium]
MRLSDTAHSDSTFSRPLGVLAALLLTFDACAQPPAATNPMIKQDAMMKVSEHVFVILDDHVSFVPNVGIVVGNRATLIVDTGLGDANGQIVLQEARKVSDNQEFYLTATHFHPEHDLGATAFPPNAKMLRWSDQQTEADELGLQTNRRFAGFSPVLAELLADAEFRPADIVFEDEITVDLGGVRVSVWGVGPNHTLGDTVFFVEEDAVLFTGDVVMSVFPAVSAQSASIDKWIQNMNDFETLNPQIVVPAHGRMGGVELIRRYREYLTTVQSRVGEAKRQGASVDEATAMLAESLAEQFADLQPVSGPAAGRINAAIQAAYREIRY